MVYYNNIQFFVYCVIGIQMNKYYIYFLLFFYFFSVITSILQLPVQKEN